MTEWMPWKVAKKDFKIVRRKKSILFYTIGLPLFLAIFFSIMDDVYVANANASDASLGLASLTFVFVILAAVLPTAFASYSIVGEKMEKSLEPLLSTPTTDDELLLGKGLAAFVPAVFAIWAGGLVFMVATDYFTYNVFSGLYFPSLVPGIMLFLLAPLAATLGVEVAVILSARVGDVRGANQFAGLMYIPFLFLFIAGVDGAFPFSVANLLTISGVVLITDLVLLFLTRATFNREEILTRWK
jgi:ABC-type Na+ efflux pump permease subunit